MIIKFNCKMKRGKKIEEWTGRITEITKFGSHYELRIESRSGFLIIIGSTTLGNFACIPDFDKGCHLVGLKDRFWNSERLCSIMNKIDAITIANALYAIADYIDLE